MREAVARYIGLQLRAWQQDAAAVAGGGGGSGRAAAAEADAIEDGDVSPHEVCLRRRRQPAAAAAKISTTAGEEVPAESAEEVALCELAEAAERLGTLPAAAAAGTATAAAAAVAVTVAVAPTERTDPAEARRLYGLAAAQGRTAAITPTPAVVAPSTAAVAPTPRTEEVVVPAPATPLLSLYRAVLGRAGTPARPSTLRRPLQVPDGSPTGRPPLSPLKLSQAQPAVPATPEVVRIGVEEFDDSPASRPAQLVTNPKPQTARTLQMAEEEPAEEGARRCSVEAVQVVPEAVEGRREGGGEEGGAEAESGEAHAPGELRKIPSVVYRLGGNRLSTDAETGGLDTAGLDPEQREMLVQMQQAQELLEQDMQRLERQRQGQRRRDTTSPQPQP